MQFEELGFSISPEERNEEIGEILALYTLKDFRTNPFKGTTEFINNFCYEDLRKKGIKKIYTKGLVGTFRLAHVPL